MILNNICIEFNNDIEYKNKRYTEKEKKQRVKIWMGLTHSIYTIICNSTVNRPDGVNHLLWILTSFSFVNVCVSRNHSKRVT